eukprot:gene4019-biopygen4468
MSRLKQRVGTRADKGRRRREGRPGDADILVDHSGLIRITRADHAEAGGDAGEIEEGDEEEGDGDDGSDEEDSEEDDGSDTDDG